MGFDGDPRDKYWATQEDDRDLANSLWSRVTDFYERLPNHSFYRRALESYRTFYGFPTVRDPFDMTELASGGQAGEQSAIKVNHYHSIGQALVTLTTSQKPKLECVATNAEVESLQDTQLAQSLVDYYQREKGLEKAILDTVVSSVVMGTGYTLITWNPAAGNIIYTDPETGAPVFEGDVEVSSKTPFDVVLDLDWRGSSERPWVITREFESKWDVAEQYPDARDEILRANSDTAASSQWPMFWSGAGLSEFKHNRDQVPVFTLYHRKTRSVPEGLMVKFISGKTILFRGGLPYGDHLPLHAMSAGSQLGSTDGHTSLWNLLALQKGTDAAFSTALTNLSLFGTGTLIVPKGSGFNVSDLGGGAKAIEYDAVGGNGKPEALAVPMTADATFKIAALLVETMETISGVNSVVRGNASPELSGAAQALQQQMAIQYTSYLQGSYVRVLESSGTGLIRILQQFANTPRQAMIVGSSKAWMLKEWKGSDISKVNRVVVQLGNAMSDTPGGRLQIAQDLLAQGVISPAQYLQLVKTGSLDSMTDGPLAQQTYVLRENELLRQGINPPVLAGDPPYHVDMHYTVLASPEARNNPTVVQAVLGHIQEHLALQAPPPMPPGAPGKGAPPPAPGGPPGPAPGPLPSLPQPPSNPMTGNPWDPVTGGA
jgi:hypothetical protein